MNILELVNMLHDDNCGIVLSEIDYHRIDQKRENADSDLIFHYDNMESGHQIMKLTWHESRPNLSLMFKIDGTVELPDNDYVSSNIVPKHFPTHIWRNYSILKSGIPNMQFIPVKLKEKTFNTLKSEGLLRGDFEPEQTYFLEIGTMPVIDPSIVEDIKAATLFNIEFEIMKLKAALKVYDEFAGRWISRSPSETIASKYGVSTAEWLAGLGIKDNGFKPRQQLQEAVDSYVGMELDMSIKGLSSIPSFNEFVKKLDSGKKLTLREQLLEFPFKQCMDISKFVIQDRVEWISDKKKDVEKLLKKATYCLSRVKFAILMSGKGFTDLNNLNEGSLSVKSGDLTLECSVKVKEVVIST